MSDELLRVIAFDGRVRAVIAETTMAVERLRAIHNASPTVTAALGRVATGTILLASSIEKVTEREPVLTVKVAGNGPAGAILATASPAGWLRALVENPDVQVPARSDGKLDVRAVVGREGTIEVVRDAGFGVPYQGIVPLVSGEIAEDFAHYLRESEQSPSAVALGVHVLPEARVSHAGGYVVQMLPELTDEEVSELEERVTRLGAVTARLREGATPDDLVQELFPGGCQILERQSVGFRCGCSLERVERALKLLGSEEIRILLRQSVSEPVSLTCNFCRTDYPVTPETMHRLIDELKQERSERHPPAEA